MSWGFPRLWDGMDRGIGDSTVGHSDMSWDVPGLPGTLGWMDLSPLQCDIWDMSGCPRVSRDSGMGLEPSREG